MDRLAELPPHLIWDNRRQKFLIQWLRLGLDGMTPVADGDRIALEPDQAFAMLSSLSAAISDMQDHMAEKVVLLEKKKCG